MSRYKPYDDALALLAKSLEAEGRLTGFGEIPHDELIARSKALLERLHDTFEAKDKDYSENDLPMGNLRESTEWDVQPWRAVLIRIGDKKRRIASYVKRKQFLVASEGVDDALLDLANYTLFAIVLHSEAVKQHLDENKRYKAPARENFEQRSAQITNLLYSMAAAAVHAKMLYDVNTSRRDATAEPWHDAPWKLVLASYATIASMSRGHGRYKYM